MNQQVVVGMSGGVDSAVAAYLLQEQGLDVQCIFMKNWEEDDPDFVCTAEEDYRDALLVCEQLDLPLHSVNFAREYWDNVFTYFLEEYRAGRTPNPDVLCNKEIKFKVFLKYALELGADRIATGHYARLQQEPDSRIVHLIKGSDPGKDQSYFLYMLGQKELSKSLFPVGEMPKSEVRKLAASLNLPVHNKKDSTGICFIGERNFQNFLQKYLPAQPGIIRTVDGAVVGDHNGLMYYTMGQRQGLGIGGGHGNREAPWYVVDKDLDDNELIVAQGHDHPRLFHTGLIASQLHWIEGKGPELPANLSAKIRYRQADQVCTLNHIDEIGKTMVEFESPQFAITPGQSIVFYDQDRCLGGGVIESRFQSSLDKTSVESQTHIVKNV